VRNHFRGESALFRGQAIHGLNFGAGGDATKAVDALRGVSNQRRACRVNAVRREIGARNANVPHADDFRDFLKLAIAVLLTNVAIAGMVGKKELDHALAGAPHSLRVGFDLHAVRDRINATGDEIAASLDFDHANPARARSVMEFQTGAKSRDENSDLLGGFENRRSFRNLNLLVIYS
jgi:hypothetical protein